MRKLALLFIVILSIPALAQEEASAPGQRSLDFLEGTWRTMSTYTATGVEATGTLTYKWVLGGEWMRVEFIGKHPTVPVWEAHALMRWDSQRNMIISYAVFGSQDISMMTGQPLEDGGMSISIERNGRLSGIDYHPRGNDSVFQVNWNIDENGERQVYMETTYERLQ